MPPLGVLRQTGRDLRSPLRRGIVVLCLTHSRPGCATQETDAWTMVARAKANGQVHLLDGAASGWHCDSPEKQAILSVPTTQHGSSRHSSDVSSAGTKRRQECRRGTDECVRHGIGSPVRNAGERSRFCTTTHESIRRPRRSFRAQVRRTQELSPVRQRWDPRQDPLAPERGVRDRARAHRSPRSWAG